MTLEQMPEQRFLRGLVMVQGILICSNVLVQNVSPVFVFCACGQVSFLSMSSLHVLSLFSS